MHVIEGLKLYPVRCKEDLEDRSVYVHSCPACGGRASGTDSDVITSMHPGNEAMSAVVVQKIMQALPPGPTNGPSTSIPYQGRKLLSFSDNRQAAAFFAPYFQKTSFDIALRTALWQVVSNAATLLDFPQLTRAVFDHWQPELAIVDAKGVVKRTTQPAAIAPTRFKYKSRFTLQSKKRTVPTGRTGALAPINLNPAVEMIKFSAHNIRKEEMITGKTCPTRVVRSIIHIGRPEYQGAGVWA
jgi:hypothetical protein